MQSKSSARASEEMSDRTFRIVNRSNLDCLFEMCSTDPEDVSLEARYLKLISVAKVDNQHMNNDQLDSAHLFDDMCTLPAKHILERLVRNSQAYKVDLVHALNTQNQKFQLSQKINKIDYLQRMSDYDASFDIEMTYTWLDWRIMDLLNYGNLEISDVDEEQQL